MVEAATAGTDGRQKLMLSASNIPLPTHHDDPPSTDESIREQQSSGTTVLLLPAFTLLRHVTPASVPALLDSPYFQSTPTNVSALSPAGHPRLDLPHGITAGPTPHKALILLCSQKTRDARCGQSAPLLKREFERHLRPLGLHRDLDDDRPGGVGIYFTSHVGGHKYSANVMVYRSTEMVGLGEEEAGEGEGKKGEGAGKEAAQCIWLARVRPEDCENIVRYTVMQGKVVKPQRQLRGGFDRERGVCSW